MGLWGLIERIKRTLTETNHYQVFDLCKRLYVTENNIWSYTSKGTNQNKLGNNSKYKNPVMSWISVLSETKHSRVDVVKLVKDSLKNRSYTLLLNRSYNVKYSRLSPTTFIRSVLEISAPFLARTREYNINLKNK